MSHTRMALVVFSKKKKRMALVVRRIYAPAVVLPDLLGKEIKKALATVQKKN